MTDVSYIHVGNYIGWCWAHTQYNFYFRRGEVNMESCCSDVYQSCWYWVFRNSLPVVLWHIVGIIHQRIFEIFYWILYHLNAILVLYFSIMIIELVCGLTNLQLCISSICRLHSLGSGGTSTEPSNDSNASEYFFESILAITWYFSGFGKMYFKENSQSAD